MQSWQVDLLNRLEQAHDHLTVVNWVGQLSWWAYFLMGLCLSLIPLVLSTQNPCITYTPTYYPVLTSLYGGGLCALVVHLLIYDTKALFCTQTHAHNHMLEVTTIMGLRGAWWSAVQLHALDRDLIWVLPIGLCFLIEFIYYFPALWGRHIRYCPMNDKGHTEFSELVRGWMTLLDILWFGSQTAFVLCAMYFNDELSSGRPGACF